MDPDEIIEVEDFGPCIEAPARLNDNPNFVARREERRQRGIFAKRMRVLPVVVRYGLTERQRLNADRRHKNY